MYHSTLKPPNKVSITLKLAARPYIQRLKPLLTLYQDCTSIISHIVRNWSTSCPNYHKIANIKKSIVDVILAKRTENNGVFIPSTINKENPVFFAIDNADLTIDTPDGKGHGTGTVVYQQCTNKKVSFVTVCK